jgi:predicted dinucleotide-binding enzyme
MRPKVAIIGKGNVGGAIARGLERAGYPVRAVGAEPAEVKETAAWGEVLILAVPFGAVGDAVRTIGDAAAGKTLIDATNPLTEDMKLAIGCTTSGAEELQKKVPAAHVVKCFNTIFAKHMSTGEVLGRKLTFFAAGDDARAKEQALGIGRDLGFDPVDAGPLENARWLETLAYFNMQLGLVVKMGTDIGFSLIHEGARPAGGAAKHDRAERRAQPPGGPPAAR